MCIRDSNYTEYKKQKEKQRVSQQKKYDAQQKEIARLNELIEKFKHKPKKASMARSKKKVLERMQKVEKPDKEEAYIFKEKLEPLMPGAKNVLETEHLKIGYKNPIRELTLRIRRGQKICLLYTSHNAPKLEISPCSPSVSFENIYLKARISLRT